MALSRIQYLLTKVAEEAAEVGQMALKNQHFGLHETQPGSELTNWQRFVGEFNDLMAVVHMLENEAGVEAKLSDEAMNEKRKKVQLYYKYSQSLGLVE